MRQSQLFTKTRREAPKDELAKNAQLLIRAGFVHKEMAGVYSLLPLGLRTLEKINAIIRKEMGTLGAQEVNMSALQNPETWQKTGRWSDTALDVWFKTKLQNDSELGLGVTHEEPLTNLLKDHVRSYRDLPLAVYQIQTKFRNETRAKSGLLRCREFAMKDLYSFHTNQADLDNFYERVKQAYRNIFDAVGIGDRTYITFASGGAFSQFSHEFQTLCEAGEDTIYLADDKGVAVNVEVATEDVLKNLGFAKEELVPHKAIEVGNIFNLGSKYADALGLTYLDSNGKPQSVLMASYGLGPTRLLGTVAEILSDESGLIWPNKIAPFAVHLIEIKNPRAAEIYEFLNRAGVETLWDDRDVSAGEKFADADLIGIPDRVVVSDKTMASGGVEIKNRKTGTVEFVTVENLSKFLHV